MRNIGGHDEAGTSAVASGAVASVAVPSQLAAALAHGATLTPKAKRALPPAAVGVAVKLEPGLSPAGGSP